MIKAGERVSKAKVGLVLDNSIVMAWSFEDESDEYADAVLDRLSTARALVPAVWPLEVANAWENSQPKRGVETTKYPKNTNKGPRSRPINLHDREQISQP